MLILIGFAVSIACKSAQILSVSALDTKLRSQFSGQLTAIGLIDQILDRDQDIVALAVVVAIHIVVDGNEADALIGKNHFKVSARLDILSSKTGEILYNHAINLSRANCVQNSTKTGAIIVRPGIAIIVLLQHEFNVVVGGDILPY